MGIQQFDETIPVTAFGAPANGAAAGTLGAFGLPAIGDIRLDQILAYGLQAVGYTLSLYYTPAGGSPFLLGTATVPAGAGTGGVAPLDVLAAIFGSTYHYLIVKAGDTLSIALSVTQSTTAGALTFYAVGIGGRVG